MFLRLPELQGGKWDINKEGYEAGKNEDYIDIDIIFPEMFA